MRRKLEPRRAVRRLPSSILLAGALGLLGAGSASAAAVGEVSEFSAGITANSNPSKIVAGPDGNVWFTERNPEAGNRIARITPAGSVTQFPVLFDSVPQGITAGPDGNLWFTETKNPECVEVCRSKVGSITPSGTVTEFHAGITSGSQPWEITAGPGGKLWFTEFNNPGPSDTNKIATITTAGSVEEFPFATTEQHAPTGITAGPDGNVWFTEREANTIGRITPAGTITEFPIPTAGSGPVAIAAGADGNLWFTEENVKKIGRITPGGAVTEFSAGISSSAEPRTIAAGPDGNLWFGQNNGQIGRITPAGVITECSTGAGSEIGGIAAGPEESMWFTEFFENRVGRITATGSGLAANCTAPPVAAPVNGGVAAPALHPPPPILPPAGSVSLDGSTLVVHRNGEATLKIACTGTAACAGTLTLTVRAKTKKGKKPKIEDIGSVHFSLPAGRTEATKVKLTRTGRALLHAAHGHLSATLTILKTSPSPSASGTRSVHLAEKKS
jgi:streptogramin lyase